TATAQSAVAALYGRFPWPTGGPRVVVACAEGDRHDFGARMIADVLALDGWTDRFLGADVPVDDLVRQVERTRPELLAISVTLATYVPAMRRAVDRIRKALPGMKLLVGGAATRGLESSMDALGANAIARGCSHAVQVAHAWR